MSNIILIEEALIIAKELYASSLLLRNDEVMLDSVRYHKEQDFVNVEVCYGPIDETYLPLNVIQLTIDINEFDNSAKNLGYYIFGCVARDYVETFLKK